MADPETASSKAVEVHHVEEPSQKEHQLSQARQANNSEHETTIGQALRENYPAVLWSALLSLTIVMEGYDLNLMQNFFGYPSFTEKFGDYIPSIGSYQLTSAWQAGLVQATNVGVIIGGFLNGWASSRWGYKKTLQVALILQIGFIFISFFATSVQMLLVGQILCGLTWGVYATTGPAYASEVCPLALRGYMTIYVNLCWAMGQFISSGVLQGLVSNETQWGWRIPVAVQWAWPVPIIIGVMFAPESPWWLIKHGQFEEAEKSLARLSLRTQDQRKNTLSQINHTIQLESGLQASGSYWECFKGVNLRRTEIAIMAFVGAQLSGSNFAYSPAYFLLQAGVSVDAAYKIGLGSTGLAFVGTALSWLLTTWFGRRSLYIFGQCGASVVLFVIGISAAAAPTSSVSSWVQVVFILLWQLVYSLTIGPLTYAISSEISAMKLRPQSIVLARNSYNVAYIICGVLNPYMVNPTEWNLKGKTAFVWASTAALTALWAILRLPETKDRTYEELDVLFEQHVRAPQFKRHSVDPYHCLAGHEDESK